MFPETFMKFLGFDAGIEEAFLAKHGEILTADWWRALQQRLATATCSRSCPTTRTACGWRAATSQAGPRLLRGLARPAVVRGPLIPELCQHGFKGVVLFLHPFRLLGRL